MTMSSHKRPRGWGCGQPTCKQLLLDRRGGLLEAPFAKKYELTHRVKSGFELG